MMPKTKKNPPNKGRLGKTKHTSDMLKSEDTHIIGNFSDPVKLITAQIRYQMIVEKMYREKARMK